MKITKLARGRYSVLGHTITRTAHSRWEIVRINDRASVGHGFRTLRDAVNYLTSAPSAPQERNERTHVAPAKAVETPDPALAELRKEYRGVMQRACEVHGFTSREFTAHVTQAAGDDATPEAMVKAAKSLRFQCPRCAGTGRYTTGLLNGKPTGPGGDCFRCNGVGTQNDSDRRRNWGYDKRAMDRAAEAMLR